MWAKQYERTIVWFFISTIYSGSIFIIWRRKWINIELAIKCVLIQQVENPLKI